MTTGLCTHPHWAEFAQLGVLSQQVLAKIGGEEQVSAFKGDKDAVAGILSECGVTPLAILDVKHWEAIRRHYGLYALYTHLRKQSIRVAVPATWLRERTVAWQLDQGRNRVHTWFTRAAISAARRMGNTELLRCFMPDYESVRPGIKQAGTKWLEFELPPMPGRVSQVVQTLRKASLRPVIVAEPAAIKLAKIGSQMQRHNVQSDKQEAHWREYDPIVTIEHGSVVAIVDQYGGPFPFETGAVCEAIDGVSGTA